TVGRAPVLRKNAGLVGRLVDLHLKRRRPDLGRRLPVLRRAAGGQDAPLDDVDFRVEYTTTGERPLRQRRLAEDLAPCVLDFALVEIVQLRVGPVRQV